eukprot:424425-Rhodomonas_salina.2
MLSGAGLKTRAPDPDSRLWTGSGRSASDDSKRRLVSVSVPGRECAPRTPRLTVLWKEELHPTKRVFALAFALARARSHSTAAGRAAPGSTVSRFVRTQGEYCQHHARAMGGSGLERWNATERREKGDSEKRQRGCLGCRP